MTTGPDFYEQRHTLEPGQVFRDREGDLVRLEARVPGDGTQWFVAIWWGSSWFHDGTRIEPGDLRERADDPSAADLQAA